MAVAIRAKSGQNSLSKQRWTRLSTATQREHRLRKQAHLLVNPIRNGNEHNPVSAGSTEPLKRSSTISRRSNGLSPALLYCVDLVVVVSGHNVDGAPGGSTHQA